MKHLLYIILLSLLFFSACKSQAEQKQQEANDTIVVETPKIIQDAPLVAGSVTLKRWGLRRTNRIGSYPSNTG